MTREQENQVLIGMGIEEPSDEQVTKYLDSVTGEVKKEKDKNTFFTRFAPHMTCTRFTLTGCCNIFEY